MKSIRLDDEPEENYLGLLGVLNSSLLECIYRGVAPPKRGGYRSYKPGFLFDLEIPDKIPDRLSKNVESLLDLKKEKGTLNLDLFDHLGTYDDGPALTEIGFSQPPAGVAASILHETTETRTKLSITEVAIERDRPGGLTIAVGVRYKPEKGAATAATSERTSGSASPEAHETDQYGYRYLDPVAALALTDLDEREADLIEAFVPVAVEEAGGFAGFRATATKTISPMDRLETLTLPDPEDVADSVERYRQTQYLTKRVR